MAVVDRDVLDPIFTPKGLLGYLERIQVGMSPFASVCYPSPTSV